MADKLACIYNSGNYFELRQSTTDSNILMMYLNGVFVGTISYFQVYKTIKAGFDDSSK